VGFGWTNGVVRVLEDSLGPGWRDATVTSAGGQPPSSPPRLPSADLGYVPH